MKLIIFFLLYCSSLYAFLPASFTANYEEVHKSIISGKEKRSKGTMEYSYPGRIRLTSEKEGTTFVSNSKMYWYYTAPMFEGEPGYCTIKRSGEMGFIGLFDSLRNGLKSNKNYKVAVKKSMRVITFSESEQKKIGINSAVLTFKKNISFADLSSIDIEYADGKKVRLELNKVISNKKFGKDYFVFSVPKDTKISYQ